MIPTLKPKTENITVNGNPPLAGQYLTFNVKVTSILSATEEEIKHETSVD